MVVAKGAPATFFSYCREDSGFALRLAGDLKAAGANVWLDQLDIIPGERWDRSVEDALTDCRRMVVILSPASVSSVNVMDEVSVAIEEQKTVIPVIYRDCTVPFRLRRVQHVDFRQDYARGFQELLKALALGQSAGQSGSVASDVGRQSQSNVPDAEERQRATEQARHEDERRKTAEQTRLGEELKQAAEKARVERKGRRAVEEAQLEDERRRSVLQQSGGMLSALRFSPSRIGAGAMILIIAIGSWLVFHSRSPAPQGPNAETAITEYSNARNSVTQNGFHSIIGTGDAKQSVVGANGTVLPSPPHPPDGASPSYLTDEFGVDEALKADVWTTETPLLASIAKAQGLHLVPTRLSFDKTGMTISGVTGKYQFAGVQSKLSVSPPLTLRAAAMGAVANGCPIELYLVSANLSEYLVISGNLNPRNGNYHGVSLKSTSDTPDLERSKGHSLNLPASEVDVGRWYGLAVDLDADGKGDIAITDGGGTVLATERHLHVGHGPFHVVLGQSEGWPHTVGANEGVWSWLAVRPASPAQPSPVQSNSPSVGSPIAEPPSPIRTSPLQAQAVWLGFANETRVQDRETELRARCGEFRRVYVPTDAGNKLTDLCSQEGRTCEKVCDWEGSTLPCSATSPGGRRPGTRIALCR